MEEKFRHILTEPSLDKKWQAIKEAEISFSDNDLFDLYIYLLEDSDDRIRFHGLHQLINKRYERLSKPIGKLANLMIKLLVDESSPVVDRAAWALSIMGEMGLNKLLENAGSPELGLRLNVIWAIGRNANLNLKKDEVVEVLINGIQDKNENIRFTSMHSLMNVSPLKKDDFYMIKDYDFESIYKKIKPVAKSFMDSEDKNYREFGFRYYNMIEKEEKRRAKK